MPLKTQKVAKKHPHHYAKVYLPYLPLLVFLLIGLWVAKPFVNHSQRDVLAYTTDVTNTGLLEDSNQARQAQDSPTLTLNAQLSKAAQAKANDMVNRNYWAHVSPDGKTPWVFIDSTGYAYKKAGENLAFGFANTNDVVKGWMNSPAHKQNLIDPDYQEVGFGIANSQNYQGSGPETIVVALYGQPGVKSVVGTGLGSIQPAVAAFSTANPLAQEASTTISKAQTITNGSTPWITFALGLLGGAALAYVLVKNSVKLHRKIRKGEQFALKHPVFDVSIVLFVVVCALLCKSVGSIK